MNFSFFCVVPGGPGDIRGKQMAEALEGRFNPEADYAGDCCIYVLGTSPTDGQEPACAFHDVIDCGWARLARVRAKWRHGGILAVSRVQEEALHEYFPNRRIFRIPQHHCNFDREQRPERPVRRVGCIGGESAVQWPHEALVRRFAEVGLEWVFASRYHRRRHVVEFYRTLDVQVSFRPTHERDEAFLRHMNCLKLANAGSFGIPTVAYPEPAYVAEWEKECLWTPTIDKVISEVKRLRDEPQLYADMAGRALEKAQEYHIDRIAEHYRALPMAGGH